MELMDDDTEQAEFSESDLKKEYAAAMITVAQLSVNLEKRFALLEEKEQKWKALEAQMKDNAAKAKTKVPQIFLHLLN